MFPAPFDYLSASSLAEATRFLDEHPEGVKILAGGQSLIPLLKLRLAAPQFVLDIGRLEELRGIHETHESTEAIQIGSLVRHVEIERSELLARACPLLPQTAAEIGDAQVRNRGTIGGSLAHADPAGDFPAAILALEAEITAASALGERTILAEDFFKDLMTTALYPNEILTSVRVPLLGARTGTAYAKMHQQASGFAIAGLASVLTLSASGKVENVRVAVTGVGPVPYRARTLEDRLHGTKANAQEIAAASALAADGVDALSDIHASAEYRREMAAVFARRSIEQALQRARGKG